MCDTMVSIGDEGVLFAKNSDRDPNEAQYLDWIPEMDHPERSVLRCTWIDIPQAPRTRAVLLSRPWWIWGAEMGTNDAGVVIGNEAVFTRSSRARSGRDERGLLGMDLLRLALERSGSAGEAISVIVDHLERYGQAGPHSHDHPDFTYDNSFIVADPTRAFVLETAGRSWIHEQVPEGQSRSISNALTIKPFASEHEDRLRSRVAAASQRCASTTSAVRSATSPLHLARALRDHGPGGGIKYSPINGSMKYPCMHAGGFLASSQTVASWISDLRGPHLHWATGTAAPCTSLFKPISVSLPLTLGPVPDSTFDPNTPWWRHEILHRLVLKDPAKAFPNFLPERNRIEAEWFDTPPSPAEAFALADRLDRKWAEKLLRQEIADTRPLWLRLLSRRLDARASLPEAPNDVLDAIERAATAGSSGT